MKVQAGLIFGAQRRIIEVLVSLILTTSLCSAQDDGSLPPWAPTQETLREFKDVQLGQEIDPYTGNLKLSTVEVLLPGNGGHDIAIRRVYDTGAIGYGGADLPPFPRAYSYSYKWIGLGLGWSLNVAPKLVLTASSGIRPGVCPSQGGVWMLEHVDGRSEQVVGKSSTNAVTATNWQVLCGSNFAPYALRDPGGATYELGLSQEFNSGDEASFGAFSMVFHVTKVTDRSGNYYDINYQRLGVGLQPRDLWSTYLPVSIVANDGRTVGFSYDHGSATTPSGGGYPPRLLSITSAGQIVREYGHTYAGTYDKLTSVTRADGSSWQYTYWPEAQEGIDSALPSSLRIRTAKVPTGGTMEYSYSKSGYQLCDPFSVHTEPGYLHISQIAEVVSSDGGTWRHTYSRATRGGQLDVTTIAGPAGVETYKHMGAAYFLSGNTCVVGREPWKLGLLVEKSIGGLSVEQYTWSSRVLSTVWLQRIDSLTRHLALPQGHYYVPQLANMVRTVDGATYTTSYANHDVYGNPGTITESGPNGGDRTTTLTYLNDTTKWIIGLTKDESSPAGSITRSFDANANLLSLTKDGVTTRFAYDTQGNVTSVTSPRSQVATYSSYKRGIPRFESHPESIDITRAVDDAGNITAETDGEGRTKSFTYDALRRVISMDYPRGNDSTVTYTANSKTVRRGVLVETTTVDGFGRLREMVLGGITTAYTHDSIGRRTFESNPDSSSVGTSYQYDILNRIVRTTNAEGSFKTHTYGPGRVTVRDERSNATIFSYRAYGDPEKRFLMEVAAADPAASVSIVRGADDLLSRVTQAGVTRSFSYDTRKYLTSETNPEIGTTSYERDPAGNMTARTIADVRTTFAYDGHNRLVGVTYPDGTPSVVQTYSKTHRLRSVSSSAASRLLAYDENDNLTGESLTVGTVQLGAQYGYTANDQLSSVTYPVSGRVVNFAPDVLGRPTQASGYVNAVSYWPSGMFREVQYANGLVTSYEQNNRLWPSAFRTRRGGTYYVSSSYTYDGAGNMTSVVDGVDSRMNRSLGYDDLNRLTTANGPWGVGSIAYDGAGNIRNQTFGSYGLSYSYDSQNRLAAVSGSEPSSYTYDIYGDVVAGSGSSYQYDDVPSLQCVNCAAGNRIDYRYDGLNNRVSVTRAGVTSYEFYAGGGELLVEYTPAQSNKLVEYIHLGGKRIAQRVSDSRPPTSVTLPRATVIARQNRGATLTVNVGGASPAGTVTFKEGSNVLGTVYVSNGQASIDVLDLTLGDHTITAVYSGDASNSGNTVVLQVKVLNLAWLPAVLELLSN